MRRCVVVWNVVLCDVCADRVVRRSPSGPCRGSRRQLFGCFGLGERVVSGEGIIRVDYTREELIEICERAVVAHEHWSNRDSHNALTPTRAQNGTEL